MASNSSTTPSLEGTRTEANILKAYISESTAYTRYTYYAQQATKEKMFPVAEIFKDTAANELHHGKVFLRMLATQGKLAVTLNSDTGVIGDTATNLAISIAEEREEGVAQYREAAAVAREEGFDEIASHFEAISKVEEHHMRRFERYLNMVKEGTLWKRPKAVKWRCLVCGYIFEGTEPPEVCPGCDHPREHYMALDDDDII